MRTKSLALALLLLLAAMPAFGQGTPKTKAQLNTEIPVNCPPNQHSGQCTPTSVNQTFYDIVASAQQAALVNAQTGTTYTVQLSDYGKLVTLTNGSPIAVTLPSAASAGFSPFSFYAAAGGAGTVTITPSAGTINGAVNLALATGQGALIVSDGANWQVFLGLGAGASVAAAHGATTTNGSPITSAGTVYLEQANPGGRLTVVSGGCNVTTDQVAIQNLYYSPCAGRYVPIYDGTVMSMWPFTSSDTDTAGLNINLATSANWAATTLYDAFVGLNGGTVTLCTGPAWTNSGVGTSTRGTGAGTTELQLFKGFQTNKNSMTCRYASGSTFTCAVNRCTYLGTILTGAAAGTIDLKFGTVAAGGGAAILSVCNAFNRIPTRAFSANSTASWTYNPGTSAFRAAAAGTTQVSLVSCNGDVGFSSHYADYASAGAGAQPQVGIGLDSNTLLDTRALSGSNASAANGSLYSSLDTIATIAGLNTLYALEASPGGSTTFNGYTNPFNLQGLSFKGDM